MHLRTFTSTTSRYDFIVGRDVLKMGFILDHAHNRITWDGLSIAMTKLASTELPTAAVTHFSCSHMFEATYAADVKKLIKEAKYKSISPSQVASKYIHLVPKQQIQLKELLCKFPTVFSGQLCRYNKAQFKLELQNPSITPIFCKPYPIAQIHRAVFLKELQHLIDKGVLEHIPRSE